MPWTNQDATLCIAEAQVGEYGGVMRINLFCLHEQIVEDSSYPRVRLNHSKLIQQLLSALVWLLCHFISRQNEKWIHVSWALWYFRTTYLQCNVLYYPNKQTMHYFWFKDIPAYSSRRQPHSAHLQTLPFLVTWHQLIVFPPTPKHDATCSVTYKRFQQHDK